MQLEFTPEIQEVEDALYLTNQLRPYKRKSYVQAGLLIAISIIFIASVIVDPTYIVGYICLAVLSLFIALVLIMPKKNHKDIVKEVFSCVNTNMIMDINESSITVNVPHSGAVWDISEENFSRVEKDEMLYAIILNDMRIVIIPMRAADTFDKQQALHDVLEKLSVK